MAFLDSVFQRVFRKQISQSQSIGSDVYASIIEAIGKGNPIYMSDNTASYIRDGYLFNPSVYSIVSLIAQKASVVPWGVYNVKDKKSLNLYKSGTPDLTVKKMLLRKSAMEELNNHELNKLFEKPNPLQGWSEYIEQVIGYKLVTGNTFIQAIGPEAGANKGKVQELWNIPTPFIEILAGDKMNPVKGYRYIPDRDVVIPPEQMIHLKYWTPDYVSGSMLYGQSPIRAGRRVVTRSNSSYDASTSSFQNMGILGILSANNSTAGPGLTPDQLTKIEEKLRSRASSKSENKWIATSADLKWQQMGMSPADLAIIESDKMDLRVICNLYHVPSELFNDAANKTYSNTKEAARAIWVNAVIPALTQFRDSFNAFIKGKYEQDIYIDFDQSIIPELQDDLQTQVAQLAGAWWLTPNQRLEIMGWDVSTEPLMDVQWVPAGLVPINETGINPTELAKMMKELDLHDYGQ